MATNQIKPYTLSRSRGQNSNGINLDDPQQLRAILQASGNKPQDVNRPTALKRLFGILTAFEPSNALHTLIRRGDVGKAAKTYGEDVFRGLTLQGDRPDKKTGEDLLTQFGFSKGLGTKAAGLGIDIVADPGNLVLGPLFKQAGKVAGKGMKVAGAAAEATETGRKVLKAAEGVKDTLGKAFVPGFDVKKISPDLYDATIKSKRAVVAADEGTASKIIDALNPLTKKQIESLPHIIEGTSKTVDPAAVKKAVSAVAPISIDGSLPIAKQLDAIRPQIKAVIDSLPSGKIKERALSALTENNAQALDQFVGAKLTEGAGDALQTIAQRMGGGGVDEAAELLKRLGVEASGTSNATAKLAGKGIQPGLTVGDIERLKSGTNINESISAFLKSKGIENTGVANSAYVDALTNVAKSGADKETQDAARAVVNLLQDRNVMEKGLGIRSNEVLEAYFPHVWKDGKVVGSPRATLSKLVKGDLSGFEKSRVFKTVKEGQEVGKEFAGATEAIGKRLFASNRAEMGTKLLNDLKTGAIKSIDDTPLVTKVAGDQLPEGFAKFTVDGLKDYAAPKEVVEHVQQASKYFFGDEATNQIIKAYDKINRVFKASVTGYFPSFHTRNMISNMYNNWLGGINDPRVYQTAMEVQRGKGALTDDLLDLFNETGAKTFEEVREKLAAEGMSGFGQFGVDIEDITGAVPSLKQSRNAFQKLDMFGQKARQVGETVETNAKFAHVIGKMKKGASFEDAAQSAKKYLFDYSELTPFEQNVMKRIVPFYAWSRKNLPLQLESIAKQPAKVGVVAKGLRSASSGNLSEEEKALLPETAGEGLGIVTKKDDKFIEVLRGLGLPFEDLNKLGTGQGFLRTLEKGVLSQVAPAIKEPLEHITNKNFFFGGEKRSYSKAPNWMRGAPSIVKNYLDYDPEINRVNPEKLAAMNTVMTFLGLGRASGELSKLTDQDRNAMEKAIRLLSGVRTDRVNIEKASIRKDREEKEKLLDQLEKLGLVRTFSRQYVPAANKSEVASMLGSR